MPRIWLDYCQFLTEQCRVTRTRRTFDRALRALPITQHHRIWPLYLAFVRRHPLPETAVRVYRRYLKVRPGPLLLPLLGDVGCGMEGPCWVWVGFGEWRGAALLGLGSNGEILLPMGRWELGQV